MKFLPKIGANLRIARRQRFPHDDLKAFSIRIGVARATLQKMEKGDLSVSLSNYVKAAEVLGTVTPFSQLFALEESLFDD